MKWVTRVALAGVVALGIWWLYVKLFPSDETLIRRLLTTVAEKGSLEPGEGNIAKATALSTLTDCFSLEVEVRLEDAPSELSSLQGRRELQQAVQAAWAQVRSVQVTFTDVRLELGPEPARATAQLVATARVQPDGEVWVQPLTVTLAKLDGAWKITRVETVPPLHM